MIHFWRAGVWTLFLCLTLWTWTSVEALEVRVMGQAEIELQAASAGTVLQIDGRLQDENGVGQPLQDVELTLRRGQALILWEMLSTDYDGRLRWSEEYSPGTYHVHLYYRGGSHISKAEARATVRLESRPVELAVQGPSWIYGEDQPGRLRMQATVGGVPLHSFISISAGERPPLSVALGEDGRATFDVGPYLAPGPNHVRVELEGSSYRERAAWDLMIRRSERARLEGDAQIVFRRLERGLEVTLELTDHDGGIDGARVDVFIEQAEPAAGEVWAPLSRRGRTDARGRVQVFFSFDEIGEGPWKISGQALPSEGDPVVWPWMEFRNEPSLHQRLSRWLGLIALMAGILWLGRQALTLGVDMVRRKLARGRRERSKKEKAEYIFSDIEELELQYIGQPARYDLEEQTQEQADRFVVQIWDDWRREPVVGAQVVARSGEEERAQRTEQRGQVVFDELSPGLWRLKISAPGYVPGEAELLIPGVGRALRLHLTPVPLKIRKIYRWMVERSSGREGWGRLTPRQIESVLLGLEGERKVGAASRPWEELLVGWQTLDEEGRVEALLAAITALVEETNFSGRSYDEQVWEMAREAMRALAAMLEDERGGRHV